MPDLKKIEPLRSCCNKYVVIVSIERKIRLILSSLEKTDVWQNTEVFLEHSRTSTMEFFSENN